MLALFRSLLSCILSWRSKTLKVPFIWHFIVKKSISIFLREELKRVFLNQNEHSTERFTNLQNLHETVIHYSFPRSLFQSVFGLPCSTTCDNYTLKKRLQPGFNVDVIQHAIHLYNGAPVIEASDEARALRYTSC